MSNETQHTVPPGSVRTQSATAVVLPVPAGALTTTSGRLCDAASAAVSPGRGTWAATTGGMRGTCGRTWLAAQQLGRLQLGRLPLGQLHLVPVHHARRSTPTPPGFGVPLSPTYELGGGEE